MPTFYNFKKDGHTYSFEDFFVPADPFRSGNMWTWGYNPFGQLGTFDTTSRSTPTTIFNQSSTWKQVSAGFYHTAAIKTDGTLWAWGYNSYGNLGTNDTTTRSTPVTTFAGGTNWKQVFAGFYNTAAIKTDGTLWTLGDGSRGQLGTNDTTTRSTPVTTFAGGTNWKQVVCQGYDATLAIKTDGTLWVWGNGSQGNLGAGEEHAPFRKTPTTTFAGGTNWADTATTNPEDLYTLSSGRYHSAAIKTDGTLWTWGWNNFGNLGTDDTTNRSTPVTTRTGGTNWKQVSGGLERNMLAIKTDGTLWTWGANTQGQLGTNDATNKATPVTTFAGGTNWKQASMGEYHTVAVKTDGTLWSWGNASFGRRGIDGLLTQSNSSTPTTTFAGGTNWADTATTNPEDLYTLSASRTNSAAIKTDGTLWLWGENSRGQLGTNDTTPRFTPVTTFAGGTNWKQVSGGFYHTAAIKTDGTLWAWGANDQGVLGTNDTTQRATPVTTFAGGTNWKQVSSGAYGVSAIKTDGTLWIWGIGTNGQLGNNTTSNVATPITTFAGGTNWKQVSYDFYTVAAIKTDGTLWTWGYNQNGQLGNFDTTQRSTPVTTFAGGTNWKQIDVSSSVNGNHGVLAIKTDGTLWVWGYGGSGGLGTNDYTTRSTPVTTFAGGTNWKQVSGGYSYVTAVKTDGTLWVWGSNGYGKLGTSNFSSYITPVTTFAGGTNWTQVNAGESHTLALKVTGGNQELYVWGNDSVTEGRLGVNNLFLQGISQKQIGTSIDWKHVHSGRYNSSAIKTDGTLWTWGYNPFGNLGTNDYTTKSTPVTTFAGGTNWKQVSMGYYHTAAIKTDGTLWTWGFGSSGRLGTNDQTTRSTPVTTFAGGTNWKQVSCGYFSTAAIKTDGTLWVWGYGGSGGLGTNDYTTRSTPVTTFAGGTNWSQVDVKYDNMFALKVTGGSRELYVWGNNNYANLGFQVLFPYTPITTFAGGNNWKEIFATADYGPRAAAIKTDGTLWVWGNNYISSLGINNTTNNFVYTPVTTFVGGTNWKQVSMGRRHTNAIKTNGTLWGWGQSYTGNGSGTFSIPAELSIGGNDWKQISSGGYASMAIKTNGTLWAWGDGGSPTYNNLGTGAQTNRTVPVTVYTGLTNWKQVSISYFHTAAITYDNYSPT